MSSAAGRRETHPHRPEFVVKNSQSSLRFPVAAPFQAQSGLALGAQLNIHLLLHFTDRYELEIPVSAFQTHALLGNGSTRDSP